MSNQEHVLASLAASLQVLTEEQLRAVNGGAGGAVRVRGLQPAVLALGPVGLAALPPAAVLLAARAALGGGGGGGAGARGK